MAYSLKKLPNKAYEIPAPPMFAVWVEEFVWDYTTRTRIKGDGTGQVRHLPTLSKAKQRVSRYATARDWAANSYEMLDKFDLDWTIFMWNTETNEYDVLYDGRAGETKSLNPLFKIKLKKDADPEPRAGFEDEVEEALQSILASAQ